MVHRLSLLCRSQRAARQTAMGRTSTNSPHFLWTRGMVVTMTTTRLDLPGGPPSNVGAMGSIPGPEGFHVPRGN